MPADSQAANIHVVSAPTTYKKVGVLLLNMGGPDSLKAVKPFLYNLFSDPDIIKLPLSFLFQKPLAWTIVTVRGKASEANYALMGGASPQLARTREQGEALRQHLVTLVDPGRDIPVYIAMRYWHPFTDEALQQAVRDGIEHLVVVTLYPHFSYTTTGSSLKELKRALSRLQQQSGKTFEISTVAGYHRNPGYLASLAECIEQGLNDHDWSCPREEVTVLFSAHSLPVSHVTRTKDPYPQLIRDCAESVMKQYFPKHQWELSYQSKVGRMPWLGPAIDGVLHFYAGKQQDNILIVPISFVSDHVETLVEIDIEYAHLAKTLGLQHCHRAPVMNASPKYIETLGQLVMDKIKRIDHQHQKSFNKK